MAIEQSGAEAAPEEALEGQADQEGQGSASADIDELKRKFREALDRKRDSHGSTEGARDTGKVHGSHGPAVSRRSFRRKSGG